MAKDLVRTRRYVKKFIMMRANIQAVSLKVQVNEGVYILQKLQNLLVYHKIIQVLLTF